MTTVLDASALLAFLGGEPGADAVEEALADDAACSTVNWSETAQKVRAAGGDWPVAAALLAGYGLTVHDATTADAERAARRWVRGSGLSLGDRFCLALGDRLDATVVTADTAWKDDPRVRLIR
ncbi:type II toxin-antitoxin system VapC family toxin [Cellulomonas shaoxiangyii]|uniref:Ribonuclease VapC n=1 Tax=Cellulomonas shaoxiangyii TaxID=2566013 RepID=A0A4P7SGG9_9CELL|nr:type II toxin-antitoxin system VapC family toxin [Cellulomonas shaoxiangyii]QCB92718.1 type II toxin-antitoxin system VapC family toxin [Cellulomonas shaoxiangyii]TGY85844.1 type II toxin-antitoxin system VapC family toxin [Cellulomonas shaoxiangyii]